MIKKYWMKIKIWLYKRKVKKTKKSKDIWIYERD
jgi:hypothetical protein